MNPEKGMWVACVLMDGTQGIGTIMEYKHSSNLRIKFIRKNGTTSSCHINKIDSWCEITVEWGEADEATT